MKRPISEHFRRDGRPKKPLTREEAQMSAMRGYKRAYRCKFCGHWHVGGHDRR